MKTALALSGFVTALSAAPTLAQDGLELVGVPVDKATGFQPAATSLAQDLQSLDYMLLIIITLICVFVTGLLAYAIFKFNRKATPNPASFTHNTPLEVAWPIVPIIVLVLIGAFSLPVLFKQQEIPEADITIKAIGNQWYWSYEYVDHEFAFDSFKEACQKVSLLGPSLPPWFVGAKGQSLQGSARQGQ